MKKLFIYPSLLLAALCLTTACGDDDNGGTPPPDPGYVASVETAQQEIESVGQELAQKIDVEQLKPVITLAEYCERTFLSAEAESVPGWGETEYPFRSLVRAMQGCAQGDIALLASKRDIGDIYQLADLYGKWTWNEEERQWDQVVDGTPARSAIYLFKDEQGNDCEAEVQGSGQEFVFARQDSTGYTYSETVKVPEYLTATVKVNGSVLATLTVNTTACDFAARQYAAKASFVTGGYRIEASLNDDDRQATFAAALSSTVGETLVSMQANAGGRNLADIDAIEGNYFDAASNLHEGSMSCTILGRLSLQITADNNSGALAEALDYDGYYWYSTSDSVDYKSIARQEALAAAEAINQNCTAALHFNQSSYYVPVTWQSVLYDYSSPGSGYEYGEWSTQPVLNFEDGTTYTFEQYFTQTRFRSLIAAFEQLGERFENL